jgi:hypothetical protein
MSGTESDTLALIVALIGDNPAGIKKLLAEHVDDGTGHCRRCTLPGQRGFDSWPCIHHIAATLAANQLPLVQGRRESSLSSGPSRTPPSPGAYGRPWVRGR